MGTFLHDLQPHWLQGFLKFKADVLIRHKLGLHGPTRFQCDVAGGTLLEDGRFAFLMVKEKEDLRSMINHQMFMKSNNEGPFSNEEAQSGMYGIALRINQIHNHGIVHRDIKTSNVLVDKDTICCVAGFECSIGTVGTGFWKAPEILEAYKYGNVSTKANLFIKGVDIYSYGMVCYEILIGKLPFEGHPRSDYDLVLQGQRPEVPNYVDDWIRQLLDRYWQSNLVARPTSQEILKIFFTNSATYRERDLGIQKYEVEWGIRKALDSNSKIVKMWRSLGLKLTLPKVKKF